MKRARLPALPTVPERFPAAFRTLLHELLARGRHRAQARTADQRARRAVLRQSGTFVGHRPYAPGDDLRRIDWAACARTGELFVKQLEEEERRTAVLVVNLSPRLLVGTGTRRLAMLRLAAVLGGLALHDLDGLSVMAPGAGPAACASFAGAAQLEALLAHLDALPFADAAPEAAVRLLLQRGFGGRVHWLSDFARPKQFEAPLAALRRRGAHVTGWLPSITEDSAAPRRGFVRVADPATGELLTVAIDEALAREFAVQLERLARQQQRLFALSGCELRRWPVPPPDAFDRADWRLVLQWCAT